MSYVHDTLEQLRRSSPAQAEFYQAAEEVLESIEPLIEEDPRYVREGIIQRIVEPERQILFRIAWVDDAGQVQVNKGYRVQFSSVLGPYKGGLRFHPSVNSGVVKFLGFEQIFKNALTGLAIGGAKGGADFDTKGRSDHEVMRFCQSFMAELHRHIGAVVDVPAGDIGVGAREIGYLYGHYRRLTGHFDGAITGKGLTWGGSMGRTEATGYGCVYFAQNMLAARGKDLQGKTCLVSGAGNVAIYTMEKLIELGAKPVSCSDSTGTIYHEAGIDLETVKRLKERERTTLEPYLEAHSDARFIPRSDYPEGGHAVWRLPADAAFPCATQNELTESDADALLGNGVMCVCEGANMPSTAGAVDRFLQAGIAFGPGKAANAGGVATSQLEMQQNAAMTQWPMKQVDGQLRDIMKNIHRRASEAAAEFGRPNDLVMGANIAGFRRVANAMLEQGVF
ncbi:MAG: NADP-specific glutamate dehydrogenase [Gammaproteobacteria bacterium]|nr:NADP-specific glutamate dehydrogenase [Gammaproteobacteria bacterium]